MMFKKLKNAFITGMLVLMPLGLTVYILLAGFRFFDNILKRLIHQLLYLTMGIELFRDYTIPGIGLMALIALTIVTGVLARVLLFKRFIKLGSELLSRIPVISKLYNILSQISDALFSSKSEVLKFPVLVEYPKKGVYAIAFITKEYPSIMQETLEEDVVAVFLPSTPNPTTGFLLYVPRDSITKLNISAEEAIKIILSGGAVSSAVLKRNNEKASE